MTVISTSDQGIDLGAPAGAPVLAFTGGTVSLSQSATGGSNLKLHGQDGNVYVYMDLGGYAMADGASVQAGQVIGYAGQTGVAKEPQLDFEVLVNGTPVDPERYLALAGG